MTIATRLATLDGIALSVPENSFMVPPGYYSPDFFENPMAPPRTQAAGGAATPTEIAVQATPQHGGR